MRSPDPEKIPGFPGSSHPAPREGKTGKRSQKKKWEQALGSIPEPGIPQGRSRGIFPLFFFLFPRLFPLFFQWFRNSQWIPGNFPRSGSSGRGRNSQFPDFFLPAPSGSSRRSWEFPRDSAESLGILESSGSPGLEKAEFRRRRFPDFPFFPGKAGIPGEVVDPSSREESPEQSLGFGILFHPKKTGIP